jgi:hypothetical protein
VGSGLVPVQAHQVAVEKFRWGRRHGAGYGPLEPDRKGRTALSW